MSHTTPAVDGEALMCAPTHAGIVATRIPSPRVRGADLAKRLTCFSTVGVTVVRDTTAVAQPRRDKSHTTPGVEGEAHISSPTHMGIVATRINLHGCVGRPCTPPCDLLLHSGRDCGLTPSTAVA